MRTPVQVWVPYFWTSPVEAAFKRDLHRAQSQWRGEDRIWLIPGHKRIDRWSDLQMELSPL